MNWVFSYNMESDRKFINLIKYPFLALSARWYFCLIIPYGGGGHIVSSWRKSWKENAFDMKYDTVILCNVTKKMVEKSFQNCSYMDDDVTNYVNFFEKLCKKWLKYVLFSKINLVTARKTIFKIFFQLLKVKITYKLNIYRLIC